MVIDDDSLAALKRGSRDADTDEEEDSRSKRLKLAVKDFGNPFKEERELYKRQPYFGNPRYKKKYCLDELINDPDYGGKMKYDPKTGVFSGILV